MDTNFINKILNVKIDDIKPSYSFSMGEFREFCKKVIEKCETDDNEYKELLLYTGLEDMIMKCHMLSKCDNEDSEEYQFDVERSVANAICVIGCIIERFNLDVSRIRDIIRIVSEI